MSRWIDVAPYVGGKKWGGKKPDYWNMYIGDNYRPMAAVSLFGGLDAISGTMLERGLCDRLYIAESDASVRSVWQAWSLKKLHKVFQREIEYWQDELRCNPEAASRTLKEVVYEDATSSEEFGPCKIVAAAAAQIAYRRLSFMSLIRSSGDKINVQLDASVETDDTGLFPIEHVTGKLATLLRWKWQYPDIPDDAIKVYSDFQQILDDPEVPWKASLVVHDPPYFCDYDPVRDAEIAKKRKYKNNATATYLNHEPNNEEFTLNGLCLRPLAALLDKGARRIVMTNYINDPINRGIEAIVGDRDTPWRVTDTGVLDHGNNAVEGVTKRREGLWEFGEMLPARPQQLTLV